MGSKAYGSSTHDSFLEGMKIQPRHATYVALGVSVLLLIAGAVMLGIGVSKLNKSNNNKCSSPPNLNNGVPQASDAYFQVLLSSSAVNVSDIHSNYANASESIRQSFQNAIGNANQAPPGVTILLLAESSFGNDTSVCYASAAFMQGKAPKMSVLRSRLASVAEEVYNVYDSTSMSNQNNFANMCQDPHSSQNCKSKCTPCIPKPVCSTKAQVLLVVDTSADNSQLQFNQLLSFLSQDLVTQWPLDFFSVWVAGYPESLNNEGHTFEGYTLRQLQDMIQVNSIRNSNSAASVTNALNYTLMLLTGQSPSVVIFMTASTDKADFASAATPAGALKNAGNKLITLGWGPSVDNTDLTKLASPGSAFQLTSTAGANPDLGKKMTMTICNGSTSTTTASPTTPTTTTIVPVTSSTTPCGTVGGSPCDQRLLVIFDTSSDLSATEYTNQQNFITNNLIDPIWNNFDRFALGSFGQYTQFTGFGELHTRNEVVGFVTHTYQSKNPSSVKMALHSVREDVGVKKMTIVLFVGSKNTADIQAAQHFFHQMHTYTNLVIVAFPGADTASLKNISNTVIPWNNPSDVSEYGSLNGQIMAALNISCGCSGTSTPPVTSTTTTPIGRITLTPTPTGQTCSPSSGGPCNQKLLIIMGHVVARFGSGLRKPAELHHEHPRGSQVDQLRPVLRRILRHLRAARSLRRAAQPKRRCCYHQVHSSREGCCARFEEGDAIHQGGIRRRRSDDHRVFLRQQGRRQHPNRAGTFQRDDRLRERRHRRAEEPTSPPCSPSPTNSSHGRIPAIPTSTVI
ncbi:hypothetical protein L596_015777 [Steinernema carpocapsae]|uniref:VWFA domain-containing protein n=1 Tax=Steinernema carpocapsae TaxID=34508 RepID=A0A4U5NFZ6_STECR|nr:hypothetical protein L596_015777 [Steinernema carpocapsae]